MPTLFNLYYVDPSSGSPNPPANFLSAQSVDNGSGMVLASESTADFFDSNAQGDLIDQTMGMYLKRNKRDVEPWAYLVTTPTAANVLRCHGCNGKTTGTSFPALRIDGIIVGVLNCGYANMTGDTFAMCYGKLANGQAADFRMDPGCTAIALQYK